MHILRTGLLALCLAIFALPLPATAQQPPRLERLEEGEAPEITIRKPDTERKITEKKQQGKVTEIKVQSGKSTYYLKPNEPAGSAAPGDTESNANRAPQWLIKEFDVTRDKELQEKGSAETPQPPAPAPAR